MRRAIFLLLVALVLPPTIIAAPVPAQAQLVRVDAAAISAAIGKVSAIINGAISDALGLINDMLGFDVVDTLNTANEAFQLFVGDLFDDSTSRKVSAEIKAAQGLLASTAKVAQAALVASQEAFVADKATRERLEAAQFMQADAPRWCEQFMLSLGKMDLENYLQSLTTAFADLSMSFMTAAPATPLADGAVGYMRNRITLAVACGWIAPERSAALRRTIPAGDISRAQSQAKCQPRPPTESAQIVAPCLNRDRLTFDEAVACIATQIDAQISAPYTPVAKDAQTTVGGAQQLLGVAQVATTETNRATQYYREIAERIPYDVACQMGTGGKCSGPPPQWDEVLKQLRGKYPKCNIPVRDHYTAREYQRITNEILPMCPDNLKNAAAAGAGSRTAEEMAGQRRLALLAAKRDDAERALFITIATASQRINATMPDLARQVGAPPIGPAQVIPEDIAALGAEVLGLTPEQLQELLAELQGMEVGDDIAALLRQYGLDPSDPGVQQLLGVDARGTIVRPPDVTASGFDEQLRIMIARWEIGANAQGDCNEGASGATCRRLRGMASRDPAGWASLNIGYGIQLRYFANKPDLLRAELRAAGMPDDLIELYVRASKMTTDEAVSSGVYDQIVKGHEKYNYYLPKSFADQMFYKYRLPEAKESVDRLARQKGITLTDEERLALINLHHNSASPDSKVNTVLDAMKAGGSYAAAVRVTQISTSTRDKGVLMGLVRRRAEDAKRLCPACSVQIIDARPTKGRGQCSPTTCYVKVDPPPGGG